MPVLEIISIESVPTRLLKKPPGEGTGPTMHADFRGNLVGRVPSRELDVFQPTATAKTTLVRPVRPVRPVFVKDGRAKQAQD